VTQTEIILIFCLLAGVGVAAFIAHAITVWREESARLERALKLHEKHAAQRQAAEPPTREYPSTRA
jgi:hypothetical protein